MPNSLNVHHKYYESGKLAWEYPDDVLVTLCRDCHENEHEIVPYPKVGKIYKFHHSDYENDMLCYFVDNKRKYVYLFGIDNGAYGTPYIFSVPMNDLVMRFRNSSLSFDDKILAFPLLANGELTPVSAPWIFLSALKGGYLRGYSESEDSFSLYIDDSFEEDPLHLEIELDEETMPVSAQIIWQDRRILSLQIRNFTIL